MEVVFSLDLPHGRCVGVRISDETSADSLHSLHEDERAFAQTLAPGRRPSWIAGRLALRAAIGELGLSPGAILATDRGAPTLPDGVQGSISHKRTLAIGLAALRTADTRLGVDLEVDAALRVDIARRVLRPDELATLTDVSPEIRQREVLLRLSAKEAIYKALDPFVRRHVSFQEAEIHLQDDGTTHASLFLTSNEGPYTVDVRWLAIAPASLGPHFITTARIGRVS
jgi:enterobactin synthetase component D